MTAPPDLAQLERQALALWEAKDLEAADATYTTLIERTAASHYRLPDFLGSRASVRAELGRHDEARADFESALAGELQQGNSNASASVAVARYFLGEHALRLGEHERALQVVQPSLEASPSLVGLLQLVSAQALAGIGRLEEARRAARAAIQHASQRQRPEFKKRLDALLKTNNSG